MIDNIEVIKITNDKKHNTNKHKKKDSEIQIQTQIADSYSQKIDLNIDKKDEKSSPRSKNEILVNTKKSNDIMIYNERKEHNLVKGDAKIKTNHKKKEKNIPKTNENVIPEGVIYSLEVICPFCNKKIQTRIESSCSCCTAILYILIVIIFPIIFIPCVCICGAVSVFGCCCDGDCCSDVKHICPNCGKVIGESSSRKRICPKSS